MAKFKIGWNDGHTLIGKGTGAVGKIKETDRNRRIGNKVKVIFRAEYDCEIVDCTIDKSNNDMADACKRANEAKCDVFISNHVNAGGGVGFEGFYSRLANSTAIAKGKIIYDELIKTKSCLSARRYCSDYSYKKFDLYVLKNTNMPAFLFEIGFVDNQKCVNAINDDEVARAYVNGIAKAYGLKKKNGSSNSDSKPSTPQPSNDDMFRVRKSWTDSASQKGAYKDKDNAIAECKKHSGYKVFDKNGKEVYSNGGQTVTPPKPPIQPNKPHGNAWVLKLQKELNKQGYKDKNGRKLVEDGFVGELTLSACPTLRQGAKGNITKIMQEKLNSLGYSTNGIDGIYGNGTKNAVIKFQKAKKISADGIVGQGSWRKLLGL